MSACRIQELYVEALESLERVQNLRPGRCDLPSVERGRLKNVEVEKVLLFVGLNVRGEWVAKQDAVLMSLNDCV